MNNNKNESVKYSELLDQFFRLKELNPNSFSDKFGGSDVTYRNILSGKTDNVSYKIKARIEEAFKITINDTDPNNITYVKKGDESIAKELRRQSGTNNITNTPGMPSMDVINSAGERTASLYTYNVVSRITTGGTMLYEEADVIGTKFFRYHDKTGMCFCVTVEDEAMMPKIAPGDFALIDPSIDCTSGDTVCAVIKGRYFIRKFYEMKDGSIELRGATDLVPVIFTSKGEMQRTMQVIFIAPKEFKP